MIEGTLYIIGLSTPLVKYMEGEEATYALEEVYEEIVEQHWGVRALGKKVLRV